MDLTKPQKMIWQMEQFAGGAVSVICTSVLWQGCRDPAQLQWAAEQLFLHNDALRTRIRTEDRGIRQYVTLHEACEVPVLCFGDSGEMTLYAERYAKTALDINGPLCELNILLLPDRYGLLVKIHHLVADAWTMALLVKQYQLLLDGKQPHFGSYCTYQEREMAYEGSTRYVRDKTFFMDMVRHVEEPALISNQCTDTLAADRICLQIPPESASRIRKFADNMEISVFSVFSAVLGCYISRINACAEQVFFGTTVLNRMDEEEMCTAGMYVNTVPVLIMPQKGCAFREFLEQTEDMLMSVFRHQRYNYTQLQADMSVEHSFPGRLFDVILNYVNAAVESSENTPELLWHHNGIQNESLQIHIDDRNQEGLFRVTYDYQSEKFSERQIRQLHTHLMNLLCDGMENPDKDCQTLCMLSAAEQQLLFRFNDTQKAYPAARNATIASLFEENAERNLSKSCIFMNGESVAYGQFLRNVRAIDGQIRSRTPGKKSVIAVIAERSVQMYWALYGILRGGNAYLPITPDTPKERVSYLLHNSGATLVIAQKPFMHLAENVPCMELRDTFSGQETVPEIAAEPQDTAYVMYTSGSTGMPKGVIISHESVLNRLLWMNDAYPLGEEDVILQKTVYSFDVSVWEIFWWGICGGAMAVSLPGEHALANKILREVSLCKVTRLHFVPSVFAVFLRYLEEKPQERQKFETVRHVFLSGETLEPGLTAQFYRMFDYGNVQLHNLYGPTECTVDVTCYDCVPGETTTPIGRPISNTQIYIMDRYLNLLPPGIRGELVIGGKNVGQGYINAPELTRERFVQNPFGSGRLYRTGDQAYIRQDGQIIFCGRADLQVKINGQRVEPAEIEAVVKGVPSVESVAVVVRENRGNKQLVAFYSSTAPAEESILQACAKKIPRHMIPHLVRLDRLPLHPNGKLHRKMLLQMPLQFPEAGSSDAPRNEVEKNICAAFSRILSVADVGRSSDFFSLGGDSLSLMTFLAESGYAEQITVAQFVGNPTPEKLAALVMAEQKDMPRHLQIISQPQTISRVYVMFPFAGGGAEQYASLAGAMSRQDATAALYFVPYLHSSAECEDAAEEIAALVKDKDVYFYSHCAGSAVALCVLGFLEQNHKIRIKHYFAAASIPFAAGSGFNGWHWVPDRVLLRILKAAGAPAALLQSEHAADIAKRFRRDTDFAFGFYSASPERCSCPTTLILGRKDIFTRFFPDPKKYWSNHVEKIHEIHPIATSSHYFQSEQCDTLARVILSRK